MAYQFSEGVSSAYPFGFESSLFNTAAHRALQLEEGWISFYIIHEKLQRIDGAVHFCLNQEIARSPHKAPFGSVEFREDVPSKVVFDFISFFTDHLARRGVKRIEIKHYSFACNDAASSLLTTFFINQGFTINNAEVGSILDISTHTENTFHRSERRKLSKAIGAGLKSSQLHISELKTVYDFIYRCRVNKGYDVSMTIDELQRMVVVLPQSIVLFGTFSEEKLAAASICVRVSSGVLYDFYHDHNESFDSLSPVVVLVDHIIAWCKKESIEILDFGTSAINDSPNFSLLHFKTLLGAQPSVKLTFSKSL